MKIDFNRRTFLILLGAAGATAAVARPSHKTAIRGGSTTNSPMHFFGENPAYPAARPRTSAITYLEL